MNKQIHLNIGPEGDNLQEELPMQSRHTLDISRVDAVKKEQARQDVSLDLKDEIKNRSKAPGRICIVGEGSVSRAGLGRIPMLVGALFMILTLNLGQLIFLGKSQGEEALALASQAFVSLQSAGDSFLSSDDGSDFILFSDAEENFLAAKEKGSFLIDHGSNWLSEPKQVESLRSILNAGELMAEIGQHLALARQQFEAIPEEGSLTDFLRSVSESELEPAGRKMSTVMELLSTVDLEGTGYEDQFDDYYDKLSAANDAFDIWMSVKEPLLSALGDRYPQHYLVLLQNNAEMRHGGGFIGSVARVEVNDGRIGSIDFSDVYDYDNRLFDCIEVPAHEIRNLAGECAWRLRDSGTSPDFPTAAENALYLWDLEGGDGVDGVIGVNVSSAQALLEVLGPIQIPALSQPLTAENFPVVMSTLVEAKVAGATSPKAILGEFLNAFMDQAKQSEAKPLLGSTLLEEARKKQINLYHTDAAVQGMITSMGMDAELPKLSELQHDFLLTTFVNIGGNKTDRYMRTALGHDTHILADGSVVSAVTVEREHSFNEATLAWVKSTLAGFGFRAWNKDLEGLIGAADNTSGLRIYVPEGAQVLDVMGDAYRDEFQLYYDEAMDLSYYYIEQTIPAGSSQSFTMLFQLPDEFESGDFPEYAFELFKQPGLQNVSYRVSVTAPDDILLSSEPVANTEHEEADYALSGPLNNDVAIKLLYR